MPTVQDILDTELPRPTWALRPGLHSPLPEGMTVQRPDTQPYTARTLDPVTGKYVAVPADRKRIYGPEQGLLVEAASRTNHVQNSSAITDSNWSAEAGSEGAGSSIIKGETAYHQDRNIRNEAGTFSGSDEVAWGISEQNGSPTSSIGVFNRTQVTWVTEVKYDWSTDSFTTTRGEDPLAEHARVLSTNGPNGGRVVLLIIRHNSGFNEHVSGEEREIWLRGDPDGSGNSTYFHHAQIEEAPNASSPIVTDGSATTRGGDDYTIFSGSQPAWWNPSEMTMILDVVPQHFQRERSGKHIDWAGGLRLKPSSSRVEIFDNNLNGTNLDGGAADPFARNRIAVSVTPSEIRLSANGADNTSSQHDGSLLSATTVGLGNNALSVIKRWAWIPQALSESTLNTLTS